MIGRVPVELDHLDRALVGVARTAARAHRRILVSFQAPWCEPCLRIHAAFARPSNRELFRGWVLVEVDVDRMPPGPVLGVDFDSIPFFLKMAEDGRPTGTLGGDGLGDPDDPAGVDRAFRRFLGS